MTRPGINRFPAANLLPVILIGVAFGWLLDQRCDSFGKTRISIARAGIVTNALFVLA